MNQTIDVYAKQNCYEKYCMITSRLCVGKRNSENPFFTIMIPTYNHADTFEAALKSALNQEEFDDYEILIINNNPEGTNNDTFTVVNENYNSKILYYVNEQNIGMCGNWNRGVELAKGKYIVMLHDDDLLSSYHLKTVYNAIKKYNLEGIIGVGYNKFCANNTPEFFKPDKIKVEKITKKAFFYGKSINIAGMTFERELALENGGFVDEYYPNEDTIFIYQSILKSQVYEIKHSLAGYRIENNLSLSGDTLKKIIILMEKVRWSIAEHEKFAETFMRAFDTEFLFLYIIGAQRYWKCELDANEIFETLELKRKKVSMVRLVVAFVIAKINKMSR